MTGSFAVFAGVLASLAAVVAAEAGAQEGPGAPQALVGTFVDDYGARYEITDSTWTHASRGYRVLRWNHEQRYLLLTSEDRHWMRIDWLLASDAGETGLGAAAPGDTPWNWGHCMAVWDAGSALAAQAAPDSDRSAPRTGCGNGLPFTRMRSSAAPG